VKRFHYPVVGELTVNFEAMDLVADPGLTIDPERPRPDVQQSR
jgi:hypothetical protein